MKLAPNSIAIQNIPMLTFNGVETSIARFDLLHPIVSGNKWFKLKYYIEEAIKYQKNCIASFGGTYSNHIVALAFVCKENGLRSVGIIRGDCTTALSPTLAQAKEFGMELIFTSRTKYNEKESIKNEFNNPNWYWVNEGGYGIIGAKGATEMPTYTSKDNSAIICAVGTGTMMAGLINQSRPYQTVTGISVLKNNFSINDEISNLLTVSAKNKPFNILHEYHFGGYAKTNKQLLDFMNHLWEKEKIPTDIVYTGKMVFAVDQLIKNNYFKKGTKLTIIHSGGLQGNCSLPKGSLIF
jgi:1-aminocyclopropane-1-carboxylate deaminase